MKTEALPMSEQAPVFHMLGWCVAMLLIAGALLPLVPRLTSPGAPLLLEISGEFERVRPEAVRAVLTEQLLVDFYRLDLNAVKALVESLPWVATARVERAWPGMVRVHVQEHIPYARWGGAALLSESGAVFTPLAADLSGGLPEGLPQLAGPDGQQAALREAFEVLNERLAGTPFVPRSLARDARGEWTAITADGIELKLGRGTPLEAAARLSGPVRMALEGRLQEVAYVDLHYINGFAVGWRSGRAGDAAGDAPLAQGRND